MGAYRTGLVIASGPTVGTSGSTGAGVPRRSRPHRHARFVRTGSTATAALTAESQTAGGAKSSSGRPSGSLKDNPDP